MASATAAGAANLSFYGLHGADDHVLAYETITVKCSCLEEGVRKMMKLKELWETCEPED